MKVSVVMITTNRPNPSFNLLDEALNRVDKCDTGIIHEKILSVDMFGLPPGERKEEDFAYIRDMGWKVIFGEAVGMGANQMRGIKEASCEWLLSCEDDTLIEKIPTAEFLEEAIGRNIWFLTFCAHVGMKKGDSERTAYINDPKNYLKIHNDMIMKKKHGPCDGYMISYPTLFSNREILMDLYERCLIYRNKGSVEIQLSKAWSELYPEKGIGIYLKPLDFSRPITRQVLHDYAHLEYRKNNEALNHPTLDKSMVKI